MKFNKNIWQLLAIACLVSPIAFSSCSESSMDEINKNVNDPKDVNAKFLLAEVITGTAFNNVGGDLNTYLASYVEHEVGTHNQLWDAERRQNQPSLSSTFNNPYNSLYIKLNNAKIAISKTSVGGAEEGEYTTLGVAQVMAAYNLALLTDMFGDVPYSEAMNIELTMTPKIDKQEEIYKEINRLLDEALVNLPKGDKFGMANYDLLYKGDTAKWIKFANGLKARYTMRLLHVAADKNAALKAVVDYANKSFTSATEEAAFNVYNAQNLNPLFDFQWSRDGLAASRSLADKFIERNDPRLDRNFTNADWKQIKGIKTGDASYLLLAENGKNDQVQYKYLTSTFVFAQTASTQLLSFHEVLFLKAEALQRLGESSSTIESVLKAAVVAGMVNSEKSVETAFVAPAVMGYGGIVETTADITVAAMEDYFTKSVKPLFQANGLKEIANQKYLAFSGASGESTEMYNDIRRWKSLGENLVELKNPLRFPVRLPYGNSETTTNPNVQAAFGNGQYVYSEQVWWAGGKR